VARIERSRRSFLEATVRREGCLKVFVATHHISRFKSGLSVLRRPANFGSVERVLPKHREASVKLQWRSRSVGFSSQALRPATVTLQTLKCCPHPSALRRTVLFGVHKVQDKCQSPGQFCSVASTGLSSKARMWRTSLNARLTGRSTGALAAGGKRPAISFWAFCHLPQVPGYLRR
jgi:hypothetical protein